MNIIEPHIGAQYKLDGDIYEIIHINEQHISMCSLVYKYRRMLNIDLFASMVLKGSLVLHKRAARDISPVAQLKSLPPSKRAKLQRKLTYLLPILDELGGSLPKKKSLELIEKIRRQANDPHPPKIGTLRSWLRRYLDSDTNPLALLRTQRARSPRLAAGARQLIDHYLTTSYLKRTRPTLKHSYNLMKNQIDVDNLERKKIGTMQLAVPSYSTFRRRMLQYDSYYVDLKREGPKTAKLLNRFSGHLHVEDDPYSWVIFDSHVMHVFVVDDTGELKGRPVLSACLVPSTRDCIGWDISLGAPSAEKMLSALVRAIVHNGKMSKLTSDHGPEVLNIWALTFCSELGILPDYVPIDDADAKAIIERFFGTVCTGFTHNLPGTTKSNPIKKGSYNPEQYACVTIDQLRSGFSIWLEVYRATIHSTIHTTPARRAEELKALAPPPEHYTEEELQQHCLSTWRCRLQGGRINKHHLSWYGPKIPDIRKRLKRSQKAVVLYNPYDLSEVWVAHPDDPDNWARAVATQPGYQNHLMLSDHLLLVKMLHQQTGRFDIEQARIQHSKLAQWFAELGSKNAHRAKTSEPKQTINKNSTQRTPPPQEDFETTIVKRERHHVSRTDSKN